MKKIIIPILSILFIASILITQFVFAQKQEDEKWTKVNSYIYIDKSSITKNGNGKSAWLKFYDSPEGNFAYNEIKGVAVHHEIVKYEVYCDSDPALFMKQVQSYDKNNNLLLDEIDNHGIGASCSGWIDGEIICEAICKS